MISSMIAIKVWLAVALVIFCWGLFAVIERRGLIGMLIGIELMLSAASLNFMVFNHFLSADPTTGQLIVLFIIGLAAAEISIAISIILSLYWSHRTTNVEQMTELKG